MRYVAAALLSALGGGDVSAENINKILSSVGIEADAEKVGIVVAELAGKSIEEVIAEGASKMGSMPSGGGGGAAPAAGGAAPAAEAAAEEKKPESEEEEEDDDMGFGLFD